MRSSTGEWLCEVCAEWNTGYSSLCWNCERARSFWSSSVSDSDSESESVSVRASVRASDFEVLEAIACDTGKIGDAVFFLDRLVCSDVVDRYGLFVGADCLVCGDLHVVLQVVDTYGAAVTLLAGYAAGAVWLPWGRGGECPATGRKARRAVVAGGAA